MYFKNQLNDKVGTVFVLDGNILTAQSNEDVGL